MRLGAAHAAVVLDGHRCVGWCQFGAPDERPRIKHRKAFDLVINGRPDWRITCCLVDMAYRGRGALSAAPAGAVGLIPQLGEGLVERYPEDVEGRHDSESFLHESRLATLGRRGFKSEVAAKRLRPVLRLIKPWAASVA